MRTDLLLYQPSGPTDGEFYMAEGGSLRFLSQHLDWRSSWTQIIPGNFGGRGTTDLLFYDPTTGTGEFYATDGRGGIRLLRQHTGWRSSWTRIIPGNFGGDGHTDLLFYDAAAGTGEFYTVQGEGDIRLLRTHTGWRASWAQIVPGSFGGNGLTDLLFYDASAGVGEFYAVTPGGGINQLALHDNWRQSWTQIVPGNFGGGTGFTDLLFYDPGGFTGEFYATNGRGGITQLRLFTDWRSTWTHIIPGQFGGNGQTDLLFYGGGVGEFYATAGRGGITQLGTHDDWLPTWTTFVPGTFTPQQEVRLHFKFLIDEANFPLEDWLAAMREVYVTAGLRVMEGTRQRLNLPQLEDVDIGSCSSGFGDNITGDVGALFRNRANVGDDDVVIYLVRSTTPPAFGCAHHPDGRPGAVVVAGATRWTMAHETGHVLGLGHTDDNHRLMFGGSTANIIDLPPDLNTFEIVRMQVSGLSFSV